MRREVNIWIEGCDDGFQSPVCLWLEHMSLSGSGTQKEQMKNVFPSSTPGGSEWPKHKFIHNAGASAHYTGRRIT